MSQSTAIQWTDATWNPVRGCVKVSPGCKNCYAETFAERFRGVQGHPYEQGFDLRLVPEKLAEPLTWKRPRRVFVNSMSDLFQDGVPDEYIDRVFAVMERCPQHIFQILTKRAERMCDYCSTRHGIESVSPLENVWLGVSVENQERAEERIPALLQTPAAIRFVSYEPALGPIDFSGWLGGLDWIIVGGESGPGARRFDVEWARSAVQQCKEADVPVFVKQLGAEPVDGGELVAFRGLFLKDRKGGDMSEWPEDLRIREFPR